MAVCLFDRSGRLYLGGRESNPLVRVVGERRERSWGRSVGYLFGWTWVPALPCTTAVKSFKEPIAAVPPVASINLRTE